MRRRCGDVRSTTTCFAVLPYERSALERSAVVRAPPPPPTNTRHSITTTPLPPPYAVKPPTWQPTRVPGPDRDLCPPLLYQPDVLRLPHLVDGLGPGRGTVGAATPRIPTVPSHDQRLLPHFRPRGRSPPHTWLARCRPRPRRRLRASHCRTVTTNQLFWRTNLGGFAGRPCYPPPVY